MFAHARTGLPVADSIVTDRLVIYSDFDVPQKDQLVAKLEALRSQVTSDLQLADASERIHIYLFKTPKRYQAFMQKHFDQYPNRRALFIETDDKLNVYAHWGDRVAEDLRHEVCHGYLHAGLAHLPLWLDEGLAEYYEVDDSRQGINAENLASLRDAAADAGWVPDLERLERLKTIDDMDHLDYAEAWAWVHFLLQTTSERRELLLQYLQTTQRHRPPTSLSDAIRRADRDVARLLKTHVNDLDRGTNAQ